MVVVNPYMKKPVFLSPEKVVAELGLEKGQSVLDYGSGGGHWSIALAKAIGAKGIVAAVDNNPARLEALQAKATRAGIGAIKPILEEEGKPFPTKQKFDTILVSNVLSELNSHDDLLEKLAANSKKETRLLIVDWRKGSLMGPAEECRLLEDQVIFLAAKAGFRFIKIFDTGTFHYGLLFEYTGEKFKPNRRTKS